MEIYTARRSRWPFLRVRRPEDEEECAQEAFPAPGDLAKPRSGSAALRCGGGPFRRPIFVVQYLRVHVRLFLYLRYPVPVRIGIGGDGPDTHFAVALPGPDATPPLGRSRQAVYARTARMSSF